MLGATDPHVGRTWQLRQYYVVLYKLFLDLD